MSDEEKTAEELAQAEVFDPPSPAPDVKTKIDNPRPGGWKLWCLDCDQKFGKEARQRAHCAELGHRPGVATSDTPRGTPSPKEPTPASKPQSPEAKPAAKQPETLLRKLGYFRR